MKSSYLPMILLVGVVAIVALTDKNKSLDSKMIEAGSNELRVAPVAPSEMQSKEEKEIVFKCRQETTPQGYDKPVEKNE